MHHLFALALALFPPPGDDPAAVVEKAVAAHGGRAKLAKLESAAWRTKGVVYLKDKAVACSGEWVAQGGTRLRSKLTLHFRDIQPVILTALRDGAAWRQLGQGREGSDLAGDQLREQRDDAQEQAVRRTIFPLLDPAYTLAPLPPRAAGGRFVVGVLATHPEFGPLKVFFDRKTFRLVATMRMVKDPDHEDKELEQETIYSDYKPVTGGAILPLIAVTKRGSALLSEYELVHIKPADQLDDALFDKPKGD